jgi:chaperonin GroES
MDLELCGNRVLVTLDVRSEKDAAMDRTQGGLYLPGAKPKGFRTGVIKQVGGEYVVGNVVRGSQFKAGQRVLVDELGGVEHKYEGENYLLVRNEEIIGVVKNSQ